MDPKKTHGALSWMEWRGTEAQDTRDFYAELFGWSKIDLPMQDGSTYPAYGVGAAPDGGFAAALGASSQWLPYITVDDVDEGVKQAVDSGGQVEAPPFDAPGVGRIAVIRDPAGAAIALIRYPEAA